MTKRTARNLLTLLVVFLAINLTACATVYEVTRIENGIETTAKIKTRREFADSVKIHYNRETGEFIFESGAVTTPASPLEQAAADIIRLLPTIIPEAQQ